MRLTAPCYKHNLWRQFKATWRVQGKKRKILDAGLKDRLEKNNMVVYDAKDIAVIPPPHIDEVQTLLVPPVIKQDTEQGEAKQPIKRLLAFRDNNVLLEGMDQAKRLTNTVEPEPGILPQQLTSLIDAVKLPEQDDLAKRCILSSIAFDAEQVKLPIRKNPLKRMWVFPRDYGISQPRRSRLLNSRLLQLCEMISSNSNAPAPNHRLIARDAHFSVPLHWNETPVLLDVTADLLLMTSSAPLPPAAPVTPAPEAPPPFPSYISPLISLQETDFAAAKFEHEFPVKDGSQGPFVHTAIVNFDKEVVKNLYGTEVLPHQITSRSLMKAFAFSFAQARRIHGDKMQGALKTPVTTQLIQTDGRWFHFAVMQLNTTNLQDPNVSNYFWSLPIIEMYGPSSGYDDGRPVVHDYDNRVLKTMLAFYNNGS
ncbi:hypothetical protein LSTR_LSTR007427 [Laodelphax striatellus]|uniref:Large ribosomal subunit protein mL37 n=1 Tax=Laodelphax striatellus TaxID=195883 RepID=A0A482XPR6_LAOST|nr:hypothetical protein LSTR_LSTR007427 [Laodelphax striatellus]